MRLLIYRFKKPWDDGTTALKLTPMELMERLVAPVPRPRVHLTRYHGVLAPHYKHRKQIVPKPSELTLAQGQEQESIEPTELELKTKHIPWARLLARVFNIDVETCTKCGGKMKIIAAIEDPRVIRKILEHLGLPHQGSIRPGGPHQPSLMSFRKALPLVTSSLEIA